MSSHRPLLIGLRFRYTGGFPQPQRHMLRLHALPYHGNEVTTEGVEVRLLPQSGSETFQRLTGVVLPAVETRIDEGLDAPPQGVEQCGDGKGRDDYGKLVALTEERR